MQCPCFRFRKSSKLLYYLIFTLKKSVPRLCKSFKLLFYTSYTFKYRLIKPSEIFRGCTFFCLCHKNALFITMYLCIREEYGCTEWLRGHNDFHCTKNVFHYGKLPTKVSSWNKIGRSFISLWVFGQEESMAAVYIFMHLNIKFTKYNQFNLESIYQ